MKLSKEVLMNGIGKLIYNTKDKIVGRIADVTENKNNKPVFLILSSDQFSEFGSKYFAVPLTNTYIKISDEEKIVLTIKKDDLDNAAAIDFDHNSIIQDKNFIYSVYELTGYHCPLTSDSSKKYIN